MNNPVLQRLSLCFVLLVLLASRLIYANDDVLKIDRIVALVEQTVITEKELNDRIKTLVNQLNKQKIEIPPTDVLQKQMLERMVLEKLQISFAQQTGLKVEDALLDKTIERIAEQNKLDLAEFKKALASEGMSFRRFREDLRNEILLSPKRARGG